MAQVIIIGGGPAGLSAAVNVRARNQEALVLSGPAEENPLYRSPELNNYLGLPGISGAELLRVFKDHARHSGAKLQQGRVLAVAPAGDHFLVSAGSDMLTAAAVILATGARRSQYLPGEKELLGRGVSWCATCDGMLYRGRAVVVIGLTKDAPEEANFLAGLGCQVTYVARTAPEGLLPSVSVVTGRKFSILGEQSVTAVRADDTEIPCQGVFVLRPAIALGDLLPGLPMEGNYVRVDHTTMATGFPGIFACGDCTGLPHQVAWAVGQGLVAGQSAAAYAQAHSAPEG